jgi:hypothetical protein
LVVELVLRAGFQPPSPKDTKAQARRGGEREASDELRAASHRPRRISLPLSTVAPLLQTRPLRLDLIALLLADEPVGSLFLEYRRLELMSNPMLEGFVSADPIDPFRKPARDT